ncbi:exonuclease domain-containing protein [Tardiphaga sp. 862_B3_N1_1]|uniref:exonuclease domain-containing protein n=1 Tax=Tardiphaga sp. 862_B3_N1_1 TaxID=3240763 RepID=UPI003F8917AB
MKLPVLPVYYYLDHFTEMLSFVETTYGSVLADEHRAFVARFNGFSQDARCLLIRMINRRGAIFNSGHFRYEEISNLERALADLHAAGHARPLRDADYGQFLACLPKAELLKGAKVAGFSGVRTSWSKPRLIEFFLTGVPFSTAFEHCGGHRFVALDDTGPVEFLLYLYFGKTEDDLKNFALRDLGILQTNKASSFSARFADGDEARSCFHYSRLLDSLATKSINVHRLAVVEILGGPHCPSEYAADLRGRAACEVGQFFEKLGESELARQLYRVGLSADCRERLVRLSYGAGEKAEAEDLLREMIDDPASDEEFTFASDFYARKFGGRRTGVCTEVLRSASTITVDDTYRGSPEAGVAGVMRRKGFRVIFAENTLWQSLFGLLFWDELFESGQLHSGFDRLPQCLKDRRFSRQFAEQIDDKLGAVRSGNALKQLLKTVAAKWGRPNGVFAWDHVDVEALRLLLTGASNDGLAAILRKMCDDFRAMRDGFPDLMMAKDGEVSFIEVKAEGDVIRRNQLTRLRQLANAGIPAEIGRVDYRFDPNQDYVVVDIETTGGWASSDRITEIGAVRIRNHQVVGEWHSLLNPQRLIPSKIVQLTGITNEMVREAPLFAEVADSFMDFMGDGIFVAHNVNFDYGFLSSEFGRLEKRFRFPKVCTCAGMRRRFPGHKSYSLGNLCKAFDIDLKDHHRALSDARAAASLLNLMNAKRQESEIEPACSAAA